MNENELMNNTVEISTEKYDDFLEQHEAEQFFDNESDNRIKEEYYEEGKMLSAVNRLKIVKNFRIAARKEKDPNYNPEEPDDFLRKHFLEYNEKNPSPHGVTLGIEIEIPEKTVLPKELRGKEIERDGKEFGYDDQKVLEKKEEREKYKEKFEEAERLGVPNGYDLFWEFAHQPARNPLTIAREVQALIGMGLINKKYAKYPLHVTLGGITAEVSEIGDQSHVLSHALEATAWSTNADRITRPYRTKEGSWAKRGEAGVRDRQEGNSGNDMQPNDEMNISKRGVEFRTLQLQSLSGLDRHLHSAYFLGTALRAFQEQKEKNDKDIIREELADIWTEFSRDCAKLFIDIGVEDPKEIWEIDKRKPDNPSPFKDLAKVLDEGTSNPDSPAAKFIHEMRLLIIQTRTKVKDILERGKRKPKE